MRYKYISVNPVEEAQSVNLPELQPKVISKAEFSRLLAAVDSYTDAGANPDINKRFLIPEAKQLYKDLFTFAVLSGLRQGELFRLRPSDIDDKFISVYSFVDNPTKAKITRFVELNPLLKPIVERRKNNVKYLFTGNSSGSKLNSVYILKTLKKFLRYAGLPDYDFQTFRSTFGKWLLDDGVPLAYISMQLGHSSITVTEKHYAKYIKGEHKGWVRTTLE